jgi:hypothetical protein
MFDKVEHMCAVFRARDIVRVCAPEKRAPKERIGIRIVIARRKSAVVDTVAAYRIATDHQSGGEVIV